MIAKFLGSGEWFGDLGKLVLRLAFGGSMLFAHGIPKLQSWSEHSAAFPDPFGVGSQVSMGLAISAELFAAGLVMIGALTRLSLIPLMVTMAVAFFWAHGADPWKIKELAFLYMAAFGALFFVGPGRISVDAVLNKSRG